MAEEQVVTNIVAKSDFSGLIADLHRVTTSLSQLQETTASTNRALASQIDAINRTFEANLRKTGQFSTHFVSLTSDVDKFGRNLDSGRLKLKDYFRTYQDHVKTSGGLIRDLAKQQVQLQNAILQPLGKNAQGLMQFNVHVPRGLDLVKNKTALAKQELQIFNKVIQDGGIQLINWGKNTQWAGRQLTVGLTLPIAAFGKAAADAFKQADQELTRLTKVYGDIAGASSQELSKIRKEVALTAKELSSAMGVNFTETIGLAADIAATGKTGNELLSSVSETTRLAVLGEVDRQDAMKATLAIQSAFKQNTQELSESINFLNAVENQTSTTLNDLVEAIPKAGPVIKGLGGSIKDLALYLTAMREGGISASEGANALKSGLASLINPTKVAQERFKSFGIDLNSIVANNAGNVTNTILALQSSLDKLDPLKKQQALEQLFGKFQFARMNALFENLGKQGSQTLQVLDLMNASAGQLESIAGRELAQVTESASGKYRRAIESLRANLAEVGDQFLNIGTTVINVFNKILNVLDRMPDPIKKLATLGGVFTAIVGPVIMLTGLLGNFIGYMIKGYGHIKAFLKGGEGFKLLTPELLATEQAGHLVEQTFYSDAKAASILSQSIKTLTADFAALNASMNTAVIPINPTISTAKGTVIQSGMGYRPVDPTSPFVGGMASSHLNPRDPKNPATLFGLVPGSEIVNQKIGRTPQILMEERLPNIEGLTSVKSTYKGQPYDISTGVVSGEASRYFALMATMGMQAEREVIQLKRIIKEGGSVSKEFIDTFDDVLPLTTQLTQDAARQSALIVAELNAGRLSVENAKAQIISINAKLEADLGATMTAYAASKGRVLDLTKIPFLDQPVVDPATGKPNMRALFRKDTGNFAILQALGRATRTRTFGAPYSIQTTRSIPSGYRETPSGLIIPENYNTGGSVFYNNGDQVPGPSINKDIVPAMLTPGEFVIRRNIAQKDPEGMKALNAGQAMVVPINRNMGGVIPKYVNGGYISSAITNAYMALFGKSSSSNKDAKLAGRWGMIMPQTINDALAKKLNSKGAKGSSLISLMNEPARLIDLSDFLEFSGVPANEIDSILNNTAHKISSRIDPDKYYNDNSFGSLSLNSIDEEIAALESKYPGIGLKYQKDRLAPGRRDTIKRRRWLENEQRFETQKEANARGGGSPTGINLRGFRKSNYRTARAKQFGDNQLWGHFYDRKFADNLKLFAKTLIRRNTGGIIPGYVGGGGIPIFNSAIRSLANTDPLHGPLQIGRYRPPLTIRNRRQGASIGYKGSWRESTWNAGPRKGETFVSPGRTSSVQAFLTGSLEDRGRYVTEEYMRGNYDVLKIPGSIEAMRAWGKKTNGVFHRGITLKGWSRVGGSLKPLPDWLLAEIQLAQSTGNFSKLIGKEFIMRRSSWSSNPETARGFGDFNLTANVKNRRVTPASQMFPELDFYTPSSKVKVNESESIFGGKFRIVGADEYGLKLETVSGPSASNREFGGPVNAGMPYIVGEKGPELFIPRNSGGIIPNKGNNFGIQHRINGGAILSLLAGLGLSFGGQKLGEKVGGTTGSAISTASWILPMLMGGSMFKNRGSGFVSPSQRMGMYGPLLEGEKQIGGMGKSIFAPKAAGGLGLLGKNVEKLGPTLLRITSLFTKFNVVVGLGTTAAVVGYKAWKNYKENQDRIASSFGMTAEQAKKAGLQYTDFNKKIKEAIANQKAAAERNRLVYESLTLSNTPLKLTIEQYKKLKDEVKKTMPEIISSLNKINKSDVADYAVKLKTQFMAMGINAEEATKKVYALFSVSNKASMAGAVISQKAFSVIKTSIDAAVSSINTYNKAIEKTTGKGQANALNTALMAIDTAIADTIKKAGKNVEGENKLSYYQAMKTTLNSINASVNSQKKLTQGTIEEITKQNFELGNVLRKSDNITSAWAKYQLLIKGINVDLSALNANQAITLNNAVSFITETATKSLISNGGILSDESKKAKALSNQYKALEKQAAGLSAKQQIDTKKRIQQLQEELDLINKQADARRKALDLEEENKSMDLEIQKKQIEYASALAEGRAADAAAAKLEMESMVANRERTFARRAIDTAEETASAPKLAEIKRLQKAQDAASDAATLAAEKMAAVAKELQKVQTTISEVTNALLTILLGKLFDPNYLNTPAGKAAAAALSKILKDTGNTTSAPKPKVSMSPDEARAEYEKNKPKPVSTSPDQARAEYEKNKPKTATDIGTESYNAILGGLEFSLSKSDLVLNAKNVVINAGALSGDGSTAKTAKALGDKLTTVPEKRFGLNQALVDLKQWSTAIGPTSTRERVKNYAIQQGITAGQYFTITDKAGQKYTFRMGTDQNITMITNPYSKADGGYINHYGPGGNVKGPGTGTSDSIPAYLSNGEYVIRASAVQQYGKEFFDGLNAQKFGTGAYINPSYSPKMSLPSFDDGVNNLYTDIIAQLHKNEAVVPAEFNPWNPNASNPIGGTYTINNQISIQASPGMNTEELANVVARKIEMQNRETMVKIGVKRTK